ncbi:MAG: hypothetical protein QOC73_502 [Actinomycetota bacterium]|jgi:hypothetical protein|nr:hypothetical protein [Actinomycetota bacterium]
MISTLNALVAKEHTAELIAQANRWRIGQTARALLRERTRRPSPSRLEQVPAPVLDLHDAADADGYCQRAASPTRPVAA